VVLGNEEGAGHEERVVGHLDCEVGMVDCVGHNRVQHRVAPGIAEVRGEYRRYLEE